MSGRAVEEEDPLSLFLLYLRLCQRDLFFLLFFWVVEHEEVVVEGDEVVLDEDLFLVAVVEELK